MRNAHISNDAPETGFTGVAAALFGLIFLLIAWDLVDDFSHGTGGLHVALELAVLVLAACGGALLARRAYVARASLRALQRDLEQVRGESMRWRQDSRALIEGLSLAIQQQFIILDLLQTFHDEQVSVPESRRLLNICLEEIDRLCFVAPIAISLSLAPSNGKPFLVDDLCEQADEVFTPMDSLKKEEEQLILF